MSWILSIVYDIMHRYVLCKALLLEWAEKTTCVSFPAHPEEQKYPSPSLLRPTKISRSVYKSIKPPVKPVLSGQNMDMR